MRDLIARVAVGIYLLLQKGEEQKTGMLFAFREVEERTKVEEVDRLLKKQVADIIFNDFGLPEIIPTEFGGTLEETAE